MCFWMRSTALSAVALAVLLATISTSSAYAAAPERNLERSLPIARAAWPTSQCMGREAILITNHGVPLNADGVATMDGSCAVRIRPLKDPYTFCTALVHELGHLAETISDAGTITLPDGRIADASGHMRNGVMSPTGPYYKPCEAVGPPITARAAAASAFDLPASACRFIVSKPQRRRIYLCGKHHRVAVVLDRDGQVDRVEDYEP
jgi:hypothetical protein